MTFRDLIKELNKIPEEYLDCDVNIFDEGKLEYMLVYEGEIKILKEEDAQIPVYLCAQIEHELE